MNKHMTHKELAAYMADTLRPRDRARFEDHIGACSRCRARHQKMLSAMAPRYRSLQAGEKTGERIMRSWRELNTRGTAGGTAGIRAWVRQHPWASIVPAGAAVAILAVIAVSVLWKPSGGASLTVSRVDGPVTINCLSVKAGDGVLESGRIVLQNDSMLQLAHQDAITITLVNRCDLSLHRLSRDSSGSRLHIGASLDEGMLVSYARGGNQSLAYEYRTPGARIEHRGTEFLLQTQGIATLVIMKSGAARVTDIRTGKSEMVSAGRKYIVSDECAYIAATADDMKIFDDLVGLRNGSYNHLLLPGVLSPRDRVAKAAGGAGGSGDASNVMHDDTSFSTGTRRGDHEERRNVREEHNRDMMRQRMMDKKIQMNEIRRSTRTDMAPRMRRGR